MHNCIHIVYVLFLKKNYRTPCSPPNAHCPFLEKLHIQVTAVIPSVS